MIGVINHRGSSFKDKTAKGLGRTAELERGTEGLWDGAKARASGDSDPLTMGLLSTGLSLKQT